MVEQPAPEAGEPGGPGNPDFLFDAFASYSSEPDAALVRDVEAFLESLHENKLVPPEHRRQIKLCVDGSDFVWPRQGSAVGGSAGEQLFELIQSHMRACRRLILFTGPVSVANPWIGRELDWWIQNRDPADILIVVTHGADPVGERAKTFPPAVTERQLDARLWYDLRGYRRGRDRAFARRGYEEERLRLAAALMEVAPQDLIAHWREQRERERAKQRRIRVVLGGVALVTAGVIAFGAVELRESSGSEQAARQSLASRRLSGEATRTIDAMALSASALALRPGPEATSALIGAMAALPVHRGSIAQETDGHAADIVRFVGKDRLILSGGYSGLMRVADAMNGRRISEVQLMSRPTAIAENDAGTMIAIATQKSLELFTVERSLIRPRARLRFDERVTAVAFSPDGLLLAGTFSTGRVLGYRPDALFAGRSKPVFERRFLDDIGAKVGIMGLAAAQGALVAVGINGELSCGAIDDRGQLGLSREHDSEIFGLAKVPDSRTAAFSDAKGRLILLDTLDCRELHRAEAAALPAAGGRDPMGRIRSGYREQRPSLGVAVSADGQLIANGGFDGIARVFSSDALSPVATAIHSSRARHVALSANGSRMAVATEAGTIELWDLTRTVEDWRLAGIEEIAVDPMGRWIAVQRDDRFIELREARSGRRLSPAYPLIDANPLAAPDGAFLVARMPLRSSAVLWPFEAGRLGFDRPVMIRIPEQVRSATIGHIIAGADTVFTLDGHEGRSVRRWAKDGSQVAQLELPVRGRSISLGGGLVAVATGNSAVLLDAATLRIVRRMTAASEVERLMLSPDGRWLLASLAGEARTNLICRLGKPDQGLGAVIRNALRPSGRLASLCSRLPAGEVTASAFSPSGDTLALGITQDAHDEGSLFLLSEEEQWTSQRVDDSGRVQAIAFTQGGDFVAAGGTSRSIGIWNVGERRLLSELPLPNQIRTIAFLPGPEHRLVSLDGAFNSVVRVWDWRPESLIKAACVRWPQARPTLGSGVGGAGIARSSLCG